MSAVDAGNLNANDNLNTQVSFEWHWRNSKVRAVVTGYVKSITHDSHGTTIGLLGHGGTTTDDFTIDHGAAVDVNP